MGDLAGGLGEMVRVCELRVRADLPAAWACELQGYLTFYHRQLAALELTLRF